MKKTDKAIVLENGFEQDIPEKLLSYLRKSNIIWEWYDTRYSFYKENRDATFKFFNDLPEGSQLICATVFDGFMQLEFFIQLLHKFKNKKFTFKIMHGCLTEDLLNYYESNESTITPQEIEDEIERASTDAECRVAFAKRKKFKKEMNHMFSEVLSAHNIFWIRTFGLEIELKSIKDIKANID